MLIQIQLVMVRSGFPSVGRCRDGGACVVCYHLPQRNYFVPMKPLFVCLAVVAGTAAASAQTLSELLRSLQTGQSAPAPAPAESPAAPASAAPPAVLDKIPAFMQIVTNYVRATNVVVVTNYVVVTNAVFTTNYYNAQGQWLQPVPSAAPAVPGLIPLPATTPAKPAERDPAVVRATQMQAIREALAQGVTAASNKLAAATSFVEGSPVVIQMPAGATVLDRKRAETLFKAMNRTAQQAVPETARLFQKTIATLQLAEPAPVAQGDPDAAVRAFITAEGQNLVPQMLEIVQRTGAAAKVNEAYQNAMLRGGGLLGAVLGGGPTVDIYHHVTQGLLELMVKEIAAEEQRIRTDPAARQTPAVRETFKQ